MLLIYTVYSAMCGNHMLDVVLVVDDSSFKAKLVLS